MNTDLSPAWLDTNDDNRKKNASAAEASHLAGKAGVRIPVGAHKVSRTPAAVVGILLCIGVGYSLLEGMDGLKGQIPGTPAKKVEPAAIEIHITDDGISPRMVEVAPGQKIVWTNDQSIPHILESETLLGENGALLYTPAIFPGSSEEFWVSPLQGPGRHSYLSTTSVDVFGEINVLDSASGRVPATNAPLSPHLPSTPSPEPDSIENSDEQGAEGLPEDFPFPIDENPETIDTSDPLGPIARPLGSLANEGDESFDQDALIPYNPYTVGSTRKSPADIGGKPLHGGAPLKGFKPIRQPTTGPGLWIVSILSIGVLTWFTRRSFRAFR